MPSADPTPQERTDEPLLRLEHVSHAYLDRFPALRDVSLDVHLGEKVALLGANGCGKSTLLRVLDGLVFPDHGAYRAFGTTIDEASLDDAVANEAFRRRVGFVFQNSEAQVFSATVREEIAFGPLHLGLDHEVVRARVTELLEVLDIVELADRAPYQLSGGQKKRVAIASVLVMNPDVILFDEPTAALDPRTQHWLVQLVEQLADAGKTIVVATHDLHHLHRLASRCVVMSEEHEIIGGGAPHEVLADRELLAAANLIHRHVHRHGPIEHDHDHGAHHHGDGADPAHAGDPVVVSGRAGRSRWRR